MSSLTKKEINLIRTVLKNRTEKTRLTLAWELLFNNYGIGRCEGGFLKFNRDDHKKLQALAYTSTGLQPWAEIPQGDRTAIAHQVKNEKWGNESIQDYRIYCSALNSSILLKQGKLSVLPKVEYRVDYRDIAIENYTAIMIIENLEAYIYCQTFNFPKLGKVLIAYRGHDKAARALINFLNQIPKNISVYYFSDPDPAGLGLIMDNPHATHAITPAPTFLTKKQNLPDRFAQQLAKRPKLREQALQFSPDFQTHVNHIINNGFAFSQEWLCSSKTPLQLIPLK